MNLSSWSNAGQKPAVEGQALSFAILLGDYAVADKAHSLYVEPPCRRFAEVEVSIPDPRPTIVDTDVDRPDAEATQPDAGIERQSTVRRGKGTWVVHLAVGRSSEVEARGVHRRPARSMDRSDEQHCGCP